ncbi:hypothetical protein BHM03_00038772 [Ensete ventricosum]|nr:hypothetical protein BHM03_00038772 [Ensete ventricosum]
MSPRKPVADVSRGVSTVGSRDGGGDRTRQLGCYALTWTGSGVHGVRDYVGGIANWYASPGGSHGSRVLYPRFNAMRGDAVHLRRTKYNNTIHISQ